jgi:hypothetical protein
VQQEQKKKEEKNRKMSSSLGIDPPPYPTILTRPRFWQSLRAGSRTSDWLNALGITTGATERRCR